MRVMRWALCLALTAAAGAALLSCGQKAESAAKPVKAAPQQSADTDLSQITIDDPATPDEKAVPKEAAVPDEPLPEVVAKVGEATITGKDLERNIHLQLQLIEARGMQVKLDKDQKREILEDMVREKVMEQMAEKAGLTATEEEAKAEIAKSKKNGTEQDFQDYLKSANLDEAQLVAILRGRLIKDKFYEQKKAELTVTDEELNKEYNDLKGSGALERAEKTADFTHILVRIAGEDEQAVNDAKAKIDAAKARIAAGESFDAVARDVSEDPRASENGGKYPNVSPGDVPQEIADRLFTAPLNQASDPFRTTLGWHIMMVTATHEPGTIQLDEIKDLLRERILNHKAQKAMTQAIEEAAQNTAIEILYPEGAPKGLTPVKEEPLPGPDGGQQPPAPAPEPAPEVTVPPDGAPTAPAPDAGQ